MKSRTLTTALLVLAAGLACADDGVVAQLYGRLNLALESVRQQDGAAANDAHRLRESNYRSVFGVRSSEDLGDGLHLIFQVEGTISPDTGTGSVAARDTRIGLSGRWSTRTAWATVRPPPRTM